MVKKRGQVWIETVTYTLIAFVMMGLVLSFARPKINEIQDKTIIDQTIKIMKEIDSTILEISEGGVGNKRKIEMGIKKGEFTIDGSQDQLSFEIIGTYKFSEPGNEYNEGYLNISTTEIGENYKVNIIRNYEGIYDIQYNQDSSALRKISSSPTNYNLFISNRGIPTGGGDKRIDFSIN
jgi:hypothetical protein